MRSLTRLRKHPLAACLGAAFAFGIPCIATGAHEGVVARIAGARSAAPSGAAAVTNCNDSGVGSLRTAALDAVDTDRIYLTALPCSTITLTSGAIQIRADRLHIYGPGSGALTIDGNANGRIFEDTTTQFGQRYFSGLTLINGSAAGSGGCLYGKGSFYLDDVAISGCHAHTTSDQAKGGAIYAGRYLDLTRSSVTTSEAESDSNYAKGGGVYAGYRLRARYSTISDNRAYAHLTRSFGGGAFVRRNGEIYASTISGNEAVNVGGIAFIGGADVTGSVTNSTISGNTATAFMGGMYTNVDMHIANSTIAANCAAQTQVIPGYIAAIGVQGYSKAPDLQSTIVAGNTFCEAAGMPAAPQDTPYDVGFYGVGAITGANNLVVTASTELPAGTLNVDPMLGPLAENGGPTLTHALLSGSPAINAGNNVADIHYDQRSRWNARVVGVQPDIGAFEVQSVGTTRQVSSCADSGAGSLRDIAEQALSGDIIDLSQLACSTITLQSGAIELPQGNLAIIGPGANALTIDGSANDRVLEHTGFGTLGIDGLAFSNGYFQGAGNSGGGCIFSASRITGTDTAFTACNARTTGGSCLGGAVYANAIELESTRVEQSTCGSDSFAARGGGLAARLDLKLSHAKIANNAATSGSAYSTGGGVAGLGTASITASTISGNQADEFAGAFAKYLVLADSTISGNSAFVAVGGAGAYTLDLLNSTIAFNTTVIDVAPYSAGIVASVRGNLQSSIVFANTIVSTEYDVGGRGATFSGANNIVGFSPRPLPIDTIHDDPLLGPLQDNGGPTATHALLDGSPAIDAGNNVAGLSNDQRGAGFPRVTGAAADIGAFETQPIGDRIFANGFDPP